MRALIAALDTPNTDLAESDQQIAAEILRQMGGGSRLKAMIGAKDMMSGSGKEEGARGALSFKFMGKIKKYDYKVVKTVNDVYNDNLRSVFEGETGLYLTL